MLRLQKDKETTYLDKVFGRYDSLLISIQKQSKKEGTERMQLSPYEGQILYCLALLIQARKIVEIGTLYGYSTTYLSRALPSNGTLFTCDSSKERHKWAKNAFKTYPEYKKIKWITGPALETLPSLKSQNPFDMVFIDADKNNYGKYLTWAENNLRKGGIVVADNTFLFGSVYDSSLHSEHSIKTVEIIKNFNKRLSDSSQVTGAMIPTSEGLTIAIKK